jgi:hypothetical protein
LSDAVTGKVDEPANQLLVLPGRASVAAGAGYVLAQGGMPK